MFIKKDVKFNYNDVNIKFTLDTTDGFVGYQQEIDSLTQITSSSLINSANDIEVRKFKYGSTVNLTLKFSFRDESGQSGISFTNAGFTDNDIQKRSNSFLNSFFILDFYDTYDINTQSKIMTSYITKLGSLPQYVMTNTNSNKIQINDWLIPLSFIESQTSNIIYGYTKFTFFDAKENGGIRIFYGNNSGISTPLKLFTRTELNLNDRTWRFDSTNITLTEMVSASKTYETKINDTFNKYDNIEQVYPDGTIFNNETGRYSTT